ncbi:MAG: efflux transporter outer membrane subunit [Methylovirgula sp.]|uniref:efflux transporter outer membrane subunit n=1 Tax=Methylovirgula sp. TaxID=1978224 RepID=UPI0030763A98
MGEYALRIGPLCRDAGIGALLLALAGCAVGPDWYKPVPVMPQVFARPEGPNAPSRPIAAPVDPAWWRIFADSQLAQLEVRVAQDNFDIREAATRYAESRAEREMAASAFYPSSDVNASYANERASPNGVLNLLGTTATNTPATIANGSPGFGPAGITSADTGNASSPAFNLWQYGIDASWEVDIWGRVRRSIEAADAGVELSQDYRRGVLISVLAETAGDYVALRGVQAQIAITRENLGVAKHSLALTKLRFANGATTNLDVANATADVAAVGARLPPLQRQESELINALSFMVAAPPRALASSLRPARPLPPIPRKVPVGLPSELAEKRPDIRAAAAQLHAATADIGVAIGDFYPRITLEGSLDIQSLEFSHLGLWNSRQYGLGPVISLPIFEGGRLTGNLELKEAQQKRAALDYRRTVLKAWHEVDDALTAYNAAQNERNLLATAVAQDKIALAAAQLQYSQGATDFLNVLTVQNRLLDAQNAEIAAAIGADAALISLYKALGGGWEANELLHRTPQPRLPVVALLPHPIAPKQNPEIDLPHGP